MPRGRVVVEVTRITALTVYPSGVYITPSVLQRNSPKQFVVAMARSLCVLAFVTIYALVCVSAYEDGIKKLEGTVGGKEETLLVLPTNKGRDEAESFSESVQWEQLPIPRENSESVALEQLPIPIEIHTFRVHFPLHKGGVSERPSFSERDDKFQGRIRGLRFGFGRPGGCHDGHHLHRKFKNLFMPNRDRTQFPGMKPHSHFQPNSNSHWFKLRVELNGDEEASSKIFRARPLPRSVPWDRVRPVEREESGFQPLERAFNPGFPKEKEKVREMPEMHDEDDERSAPLMERLKSFILRGNRP